MTDGHVHLAVDGAVASVVFDRPAAHNAMTWTMYAELSAICERLSQEKSVRVATFRGAGGKAFVSGTDIEQFLAFGDGDDGVAYERRIDAGISQIERMPMTTVAICNGWAVGGGLAIAAACDIRVATAGARFGVPIAKTLGNCLSQANTARLIAGFGVPNIKRMLLAAELLTAEETLACGFLSKVVEAEMLDESVASLCARLTAQAPLTVFAAKETIRRLVVDEHASNEDLIRICYGSEDFREGIHAFMEKRPPVWKGV